MRKRLAIEPINSIKFFILILFILLQIYVFYLTVFVINTMLYFYIELIGAIIALKILSSSQKETYKLSWTIFLLVLPITSPLFYIIFGNLRFLKKIKKKELKIEEKLNINNQQEPNILKNITNEDALSQINSIYKLANSLVYEGNVTYFKVGESFLKIILIT